jgi:hypothetical protein
MSLMTWLIQTETNEDSIPEVPDKGVPAGVLPRLISHLVKRRQEVKKLMKDPRATDVQKAQVSPPKYLTPVGHKTTSSQVDSKLHVRMSGLH